MPRENTYKERCFRLWLAEKSVREMWNEMRREILESSIRSWVTDWERGKQGSWIPKTKEHGSEAIAVTLVFAYGSNLDCAQMRGRCPSARFHCIAKLKDHRLAFPRKSKKRNCGVAVPVPDKGRSVWGVVYEIEEVDLSALDKCEGYYPERKERLNAYNRRSGQIFEKGDEQRPLIAWIYFAVEQSSPPPPSSEYATLILGGGRFWGLPEDYINELEQIEVM